MNSSHFKPMAMNARPGVLKLGASVLLAVLATGAAAADAASAPAAAKPLDLSLPRDQQALAGVRTHALPAEPERLQRLNTSPPGNRQTNPTRHPYGTGFEARAAGATAARPGAGRGHR